MNLTESEPPSMTQTTDDDDPGGNIISIKLKQITESDPSFLKKIKGKLDRLLQFNRNNSIEEEVAELFEEHDPEGKHVGSEERSIVTNVLGLGDATVHDVMMPRHDIVAVEDKTTLAGLKKILVEKQHTRMPVYKKSLDNITGFIHIKDIVPILGTRKKFNIKAVTREILYVSPSMKVLDLLVQMRAKRVHMAIVLDEYGGTDGLVTMENLMEKIVGDIEDEHDEKNELGIKIIAPNIFEVSARLPVEELEKKLHAKFKSKSDDEDFDTIGGLIFFLMGRVPERGESVSHKSGFTFEILEADPRRIKKVLVKKNPGA